MAPVSPRSSVKRPVIEGVAVGAAIGAMYAAFALLPAVAGAGTGANAIARAKGAARVEAAHAAQVNASASDTKPASATQAKAASSTPGVSKTRVVKSTTTVTRVVPTPREERVTYHYNALGRRDPFMPLVGGGFVGMDVGGAAPPDIGGIKVVGIVWGASDKFALVEDPRGNSLVLRKGDKVMNGVVDDLTRDAVIVKLDMEGISQSVTIPVTRKGEQQQ